ncbi:hypothetical protein DFJ73DRAFT_858103 [Zopfochytrium polystomum]|nr:hypothetical protein DFJ73DRAFT_858103 [Zopfochytrium polystomum]
MTKTTKRSNKRQKSGDPSPAPPRETSAPADPSPSSAPPTKPVVEHNDVPPAPCPQLTVVLPAAHGLKLCKQAAAPTATPTAGTATAAKPCLVSLSLMEASLPAVASTVTADHLSPLTIFSPLQHRTGCSQHLQVSSVRGQCDDDKSEDESDSLLITTSSHSISPASSITKRQAEDDRSLSTTKRQRTATVDETSLDDSIRMVVRSELANQAPELARQIAATLRSSFPAPQPVEQIPKPAGEGGSKFHSVHSSTQLVFNKSDVRVKFPHQNQEKLSQVYTMVSDLNFLSSLGSLTINFSCLSHYPTPRQVSEKCNYVNDTRFPNYWPIVEMVKCYLRGLRKRENAKLSGKPKPARKPKKGQKAPVNDGVGEDIVDLDEGNESNKSQM